MNISIRPWYLIVCCALLLQSCNRNKNTGVKTNNGNINERPNIVILYGDDQGTLDLGCYGTNDIATPHLDKLASQGLKFTQAYAHTVCCPSRAALLTGRAPQRGGVNSWTSCNPNDMDGRVMDLNEVTLAEVLKDEGYKTALIGKWHLGARDTHTPLDQGFDYFFGFRGGFIDYYSHRFLHAGWQKPQFHDLYRNRAEVYEGDTYFPDIQVKEATRFIEENKNDNFFLYMAFNLPHYPEQPDSSYTERYKDLPWPRRSYAPMITTMDDRIGKVLESIEKQGLSENTIVLYMSDNGHSTEDYYNWGNSYGGNGGGGYAGKWRGAKGSFFEGGLRVPCIISYPNKFPANQERNQVITNMDWLPTICDVLNINQPKNKLDGKSILPIIMDDNETSPHEVLHFMWQHMWAVKRGDWKLIFRGHDTTGKFSEHPEKDFFMPEYYLARLSDDNPEEINYAELYPSIVKELRHLHEIWAKDVFKNSGYPDPNKETIQNKSTAKGTIKL
ncbi:sulfatase-like hydrolase/transferase [Carboxylicivirga marina]|uniref:Sulfatase-like hydrolase/transferase n=1 Tax=Carboxylicivirga marina TaxID=2800988 RepID=A0ABS1HNI9_9BACT|nr:sulfatase-like hydrolase/transferase [Carboxylicivirga marina]MBK3519248.1 sulfatase-like hydrolase/transferase [Carboxylicivirga marina]